MQENLEKILDIIVVKRDGKRVAFNGTKIAIAIKKGFDSVISEDGETNKYSEKDVYKVYNAVIDEIEKIHKERIKIEEIQDMIEEQLQKKGYKDVYQSFRAYRERRAQSRQVFFDEKRQHKFLKALENLGLQSNAEDNSGASDNTAIETMLAYGSTVSNEFAKSYLIKRKFAEAHESGDIYIHDMDYIPIGTTGSCQIDLNKLFENGFAVGNSKIKSPKDIMSYTALAAIAVGANQHDQHGCQSIPAFDYYMAKGVLKTFKNQFRQTIDDLLELTDFINFIAINGISREIDRITTMDFDVAIFDTYLRESETLKRLFRIAYKKAVDKTEKIVYQAMDAFIHNINTIYAGPITSNSTTSINLGTDTSFEGRMVSTKLIQALINYIDEEKTKIYPIVIFKLKDGINLNKEDKNYDLYSLVMELANIRYSNVYFSFLDASFNKKRYNKLDYSTEVAYMGCRTRVLENHVDENKAIPEGRGNLSATSINLPRLGIKYGIINNEKADLKGFFGELEEKLELVKDQLIERFEIQCSKKASNFPFLLGQEVWIDSEKTKETDKLRRAYKQGNLGIGFIGLAECLKAMIGSHHGETEEAYKLGIKIIQFMKQKVDEYSEKYNLNFVLIAPPKEKLGEQFTAMDKAIYGKIKGVTDIENYSDSFQLPENYKIKIEEKIKIEAPYHKLTNGGHILSIHLPEEKLKNEDVIEKLIKEMKENDIGLAMIN